MPTRDAPESDDLVRQIMAAHLHCARCGYDLHGARSRCPECGQTFNEFDEQTVTIGPRRRWLMRTIIKYGEPVFRWGIIIYLGLMALLLLAGLFTIPFGFRGLFPR